MSPHRDIVDRLTLRFSDQIVSNSAAGAEWVIERGADPSRVSVVRNGRDIDAYDVSHPDGVAATLGLGSGPIVGTVGRLVKRKGHYDLLDAWPLVLESHPDAELVIVGDGPEREQLHVHASRLGIAGSVTLLGIRDDVPELLSLFDVFAFPSHYEGLPGALLEAMCAGLPIITTPVDGCSELISDGEHGVHVPVGEPEAIANGLTRLLSDEKLARTLANNAKARAKAEFSVKGMIEQFEMLYELSR